MNQPILIYQMPNFQIESSSENKNKKLKKIAGFFITKHLQFFFLITKIKKKKMRRNFKIVNLSYLKLFS